MKLYKLMLLVVFSTVTLFASDYMVIINKKVSESELSKKEVVDIFTGNIDTWKDGTTIAPSHAEEDGEGADLFFNSLLEMSAQKFKKIWLKKLFAGYGAEPMSFSSAKEIVDFVKSVDGAIGVVPSGTAIDGCKKVTIK